MESRASNALPLNDQKRHQTMAWRHSDHYGRLKLLNHSLEVGLSIIQRVPFALVRIKIAIRRRAELSLSVCAFGFDLARKTSGRAKHERNWRGMVGTVFIYLGMADLSHWLWERWLGGKGKRRV